MTALSVAVVLLLAALAFLAARRSSYHRGKSDAFQQVANDFRGLSDCTWWPKRRSAQRAAVRRKRMLNLCLCDPDVCDALAEALIEAREFWNHPTSDETPERLLGGR